MKSCLLLLVFCLLMPLCGAPTDEKNRSPLDKGGLQRGGAWKFANLPLTPFLCKEGERRFQRKTRESIVRDLDEVARVATIMLDGDLCQRIMTERSLQKMFTVDPKDPWAGSDNFDVRYEPFIQTKKVLMRLARLADYPVDCNLWMPFKEDANKIQILIRNRYEMSQFWEWGVLFQEIPEEMKQVLASGRHQTVAKKGDFVSVLTPVNNSLGEIVGLVEVVSRVHLNMQENVK